MDNDKLIESINENILEIKNQSGFLSAQMININKSLDNNCEIFQKFDERLRRVENLMLPIGTTITVFIIYIIVAVCT